jgi:hypothetical protein
MKKPSCVKGHKRAFGIAVLAVGRVLNRLISLDNSEKDFLSRLCIGLEIGHFFDVDDYCVNIA